MEDLRKLSFFETQSRIECSERRITEQERTIESLRSELKAAQDSLAKLEANPVFEFGKCYRMRGGAISQPLRPNDKKNPSPEYPFCDGRWCFRADGRLQHGADCEFDILPGAVEPLPTWTPPASLKDGVVSISDSWIHLEGEFSWGLKHAHGVLRDFVKPANGRWKVENGKATYLGE